MCLEFDLEIENSKNEREFYFRESLSHFGFLFTIDLILFCGIFKYLIFIIKANLGSSYKNKSKDCI